MSEHKRVELDDLDRVTLVMVDGVNKEAKTFFNQICAEANWGGAYFNDSPKSLKEYNRFIVKDLVKHVNTSHALIVQMDGYPMNYDAWKSDWLFWDYIGAPWLLQPWAKEISVGNGGFCLRSLNFLGESSKLLYSGDIPEDVFLCRNNGLILKNKGMYFAPISVAVDFSVEDMPYKGQFGFHGKNTLTINKAMGIWK